MKESQKRSRRSTRWELVKGQVRSKVKVGGISKKDGQEDRRSVKLGVRAQSSKEWKESLYWAISISIGSQYPRENWFETNREKEKEKEKKEFGKSKST